jgi:pimeloyl-ACP methyl ester carboxylesterase
MRNALALVIAVAGCGGTPAADDVGEVDGGAAVDGRGAVDAAPGLDAGYSVDRADCSDALVEVFVAPTGLPPLSPALRGAVVRCARGPLLPAAALEAAAAAEGATIVATSGAQIVKIAYRTVRGDGTATISVATAYLPTAPRALPVPVALFARSTSGLADACAPSRVEVPHANQALPLAGLGYAVIAPDFSGLGNEGVHTYLDNRESAAQIFDGARALTQLLGPEFTGPPTVALGYSQGGGVVLSAQALEHELTGVRTLRGVVAIAPEWPIRVGSFGYERVLRNPDQLTALAGLSPPTVTVMRHYGWFANHLGPERAADTFPEAERADLIDQVESLCTVPLGGALDVQQPRLRDLVGDGFRRAMLACLDGAPGCVEPARAFHQWLEGNVVTADAGGAQVLVIHGLGDQVMPAASEAACVVAKLRAEGMVPDVCTETFATHDTILENKIEHGLAWLEAVVTGGTRPSCGSALPACTP